eukprot:scaffold910_cov396-Prasinococcus_capsulatus_cf.AAC.16
MACAAAARSTSADASADAAYGLACLAAGPRRAARVGVQLPARHAALLAYVHGQGPGRIAADAGGVMVLMTTPTPPAHLRPCPVTRASMATQARRRGRSFEKLRRSTRKRHRGAPAHASANIMFATVERT